MMTQDDWNRIARYAAGECSAEEAAELRRWIDEDPERREALAFMGDVDAAAERGAPQWDTDQSWERLVARKSARAQRSMLFRHVQPAGRMAAWRRPVVRAAAALLVAAGAGLWVSQTRGWRDAADAAPAPAVMREYVTARGQRATFQLPDGSQVILGVASRLRYPVTFGTNGRRDVHLEGEAFFEVEHDERRPFLVHTARGITEDLGTKFAVQEYPSDSAVQVVVAEGSVELRPAGGAPGRGALLRPGQLGRLTRSGDALVRSDVDLTRYLAWTEGRLIFDDTPLRDALPALGRWYDLDFVLGDSTIGDRHVTATLAAESIAETLKLLSSTLDVRYEHRGRTVTFLPRRDRR